MIKMMFKKAVKRLHNAKKKNNQNGFTLLELLVVVAIMAAIAGTATIALQDTDARASAAAHVAMMDELNKGVRTFRVLNHNVLPNNFDSLLSYDGANYALLPNGDGEILGVDSDSVGAALLPDNNVLRDIGITDLRYINADATGDELPADVTSCAVADLQDVISSRGNAVVAGNIFNGPEGNGCGDSVELAADGTAPVAFWAGAAERILGPGDYGDFALTGLTDSTGTPAALAAANLSGTASTADAPGPIFMAVGMGPSCSLFNTQQLGGMTSVPVYRHVSPDQYNRFIALFHVANAMPDSGGTDYSAGSIEAVDQVAFVAVVDGAGDTKEEELGEWDGTRNTI